MCVRLLKEHSDFVFCVTVLYDRSTSSCLSRALCGAGEDGEVDDGQRAFAVRRSWNNRIKIWNSQTGACVEALKGLKGWVGSVTVLYDRSTNGRLSRAVWGARGQVWCLAADFRRFVEVTRTRFAIVSTLGIV